MIDRSPALRQYEESMRLRPAESPAEAVATDLMSEAARELATTAVA